MGGDSLAAIQFAREVDELCGTSLPVSFVLDHSHSMKDIVDKASCHPVDTARPVRRAPPFLQDAIRLACQRSSRGLGPQVVAAQPFQS
jgi:hypothetical protein